ncbi:conserved Plasmodium protein, unknown function [Plasmodium ovale wallikeri]|uniref:Uncharacterized protein n=1 Tax=Plasmodium ovale wallikeri TaxID=864142 RepID=A0A1A8YZE3_PLAOA|nr:conserved Plasmodium protein, unknown function [Plasmodium ovale wallikeri]SBT37676.1 conserved Plasmodium protein, unknown function [Plasmodium ovale wallikeri]
MDNNKITSQPKFIFSENNFWKIDRISVDIFESIADTGDINFIQNEVALCFAMSRSAPTCAYFMFFFTYKVKSCHRNAPEDDNKRRI